MYAILNKPVNVVSLFGKDTLYERLSSLLKYGKVHALNPHDPTKEELSSCFSEDKSVIICFNLDDAIEIIKRLNIIPNVTPDFVPYDTAILESRVIVKINSITYDNSKPVELETYSDKTASMYMDKVPDIYDTSNLNSRILIGHINQSDILEYIYFTHSGTIDYVANC